MISHRIKLLSSLTMLVGLVAANVVFSFLCAACLFNATWAFVNGAVGVWGLFWLVEGASYLDERKRREDER